MVAGDRVKDCFLENLTICTKSDRYFQFMLEMFFTL